MDKYALELRNVSKHFDGLPAIKDICLSLKRQEILGILGQNASAKSTLIRILGGLLRPDSGHISVFGENVRISSPSKAMRSGIVALYENSPLPENLTASEALFMGAYSKAGDSGFGLVNRRGMRAQAAKLFEDYNFNVDADTKVGDLSIAQRQMLMMLRATVLNARILLVDNCFSLLDRGDTQEVHRILKLLRQKGITILITSQKYHHIFDVATSIAVMENNGLTMAVYNRADETAERALRSSSGFLGYPKLDVRKGRTLFECRRICCKDSVKDISFHVASGEIVGVIGRPDSGRVMLSKLLCGDVRADIGKIFVNGRALKIKTPSDARKAGIMMISDDSHKFGVIPDIGLASNIALSNYRRVSFMRFIVSEKLLNETAFFLADKLGIKYNHTNQKTAHLSAGNKQKVAFARAIYSCADIYLINEPTMGIDTTGSIQIYNIMNELLREGKCIILFTSNIQEALGMCDRILAIRGGEIVAQLSRSEFSAEAVENIDFTL